MTDIDRRVFFKQAIIVGTALTSLDAFAEMPKLEESDAQAVALGYKHDTKLVDAKKYPKHDPSAQACHNCQLFQGKPDDAWAGCAVFPGKQVANNGWCSAWTKKPG